MTTCIANVRKWWLVQLISSIVFLGVIALNWVWNAFSSRENGILLLAVAGLAMGVATFATWQVMRHSRCPHCGKRLMSFWLGRDGAGRSCVNRVMKGLPVICVNCGEEVETA